MSHTPIDARPTKSFFIDMLTRDISVIASILDLCDNALGRTLELADIEPSAYVIEGDHRRKPLKNYFLHLVVTPSLITISDNCGGISREAAEHEIFRHGRDAHEDAGPGLSVYGIGMKRAFYKLADNIRLRSSQKTEWFDIALNVSEWRRKGDDDWSMEFKKTGEGNIPDAIPKNGTIIELRDLKEGPKALINSRTFLNDLRARLQSAYSLFVAYGLLLTLNGDEIQDVLPTIADDPLRPARKTLRSSTVRAVIIAGLTPPKAAANPAKSGWFLYCNGRLVLDADKTRLTGWGDALPQWHSKFMRFVGFVFFDSDDNLALPWTTTKQGIVEDAEVFLQARQEMQLQARPVIDFLTRLYPAEVPEEGVRERALLESAGAGSLKDISRSDRVFSPPKTKAKAVPTVNIQYRKPVAQVDQARTKLGKRLSAREIGSRTFDHFIKTECEG